MGKCEWVYVLRLQGSRVYVGETSRLFSRLHEHFTGRGGSCTSARPPESLLAVYPVPEGTSSLELEHRMTLLMMRAMGRRYWLVQGGRFTDGFQPQDPTEGVVIDRPLCRCGLPCHRADGAHFVCPRSQRVWRWLRERCEYAAAADAEPCDFVLAQGSGSSLERTYERSLQAETRPPPKAPMPYAFRSDDDDIAIGRRLADALANAGCTRLVVSARCHARLCTCDGTLLDVAEVALDPASLCGGNLDLSASDERGFVLKAPTATFVGQESPGADSGPIGSEEEEAERSRVVVVLSSEDVSVDGSDLLVVDGSRRHRHPACDLLDGLADRLPSLVRARRNNMARCLGCRARQYRALRAGARFVQLCVSCARDVGALEAASAECHSSTGRSARGTAEAG